MEIYLIIIITIVSLLAAIICIPLCSFYWYFRYVNYQLFRQRYRNQQSAVSLSPEIHQVLYRSWFDGRDQEIAEVCPISLVELAHTQYMKTSCHHCYEVKAFAEWIVTSHRKKKISSCPICKQYLAGHFHKLFCPSGCRRYRLSSTQSIVEDYLAGRIVQVNTDPQCRDQ